MDTHELRVRRLQAGLRRMRRESTQVGVELYAAWAYAIIYAMPKIVDGKAPWRT